MQRTNRVVTAVLTAAILASAAQAAPLSASLTKALDGLAANGKIRILVRMKDAGAVVFGAAQSMDDSAGRTTRLKAMRENARKSQAPLLETVKPFGVTNSLESNQVHSLWLANAVAMDADRETIEKLAARNDVKEVVLNEIIPAPKVTPSAVVNVPGEYTWGLARIHVPEVRALYKLTGAGVRVGHLDTGVVGEHPDLKGKVLVFKDFSQKHKAEPYDDEGHGSHTAGTIAGGNASGKYIGVAPEAKLICAKIFGPDGATLEGILGAMEWVVDPDGNPSTDDGAQIVSNSWGSDNSENRSFWDAVKKWVDLGVFPCFAAGNNGPNTVGTPGGFPHSFAVGAIDPGDGCSQFSSRGPITWDGKQIIKPDVAAPGSSVLSAWNTGNGYTAIQGTSMACPHISGVVALLLQANSKLTIDRIREVLESSADDKGDPGKDNLFGAGVCNAWKAVRLQALGEVVRLPHRELRRQGHGGPVGLAGRCADQGRRRKGSRHGGQQGRQGPEGHGQLPGHGAGRHRHERRYGRLRGHGPSGRVHDGREELRLRAQGHPVAAGRRAGCGPEDRPGERSGRAAGRRRRPRPSRDLLHRFTPETWPQVHQLGLPHRGRPAGRRADPVPDRGLADRLRLSDDLHPGRAGRHQGLPGIGRPHVHQQPARRREPAADPVLRRGLPREVRHDPQAQPGADSGRRGCREHSAGDRREAHSQ
ncbi:MAG: S8 family serine peptidase [Candidatus Wallbacteria bacterium]|nr:S8 family serine peptidase [Candidatus Wallbacteria bacterium]